MSTKRVGMVTGTVNGRYSKELLVCQYHHRTFSNKGVWFGNDPFNDSSTLLIAQFICITLVTRTIYILLKPLRQGMLTPQVMAGIIIGPTILGRFMGPQMYRLFPMAGKVELQTIANIGFNFHLFILGLKMDTSLLKNAGRRAVLIGVLCFLIPLTAGGLTYLIVSRITVLDFPSAGAIPIMIAMNSVSSFAVVTSLLTDLKILNSELGRLATSTAMVSDMCGWLMVVSGSTLSVGMAYSKWKALSAVLAILSFFIAVMFIFRPFIVWLTKNTPKGQPMNENHFAVVAVVLLVSSFWCEALGQHSSIGALVLGIALPGGPPLGAAMVQKVDTMATVLLLPVFLAISGMQTDMLSIADEGKSTAIILLIIVMSYLGKFSGTILSALYCKVPFWEAVTLSLILCSKGTVDVAIYVQWKDRQILDDQSFSILLMTMLVVIGVSRPMIRYLYDPSRRYRAYGRRTILHTKDNIQLKILVCVYQEDNVLGILNLLQVSNFSFFTPVSIFVLHLMELTGRAAAILVPHHHHQHRRHLDHFTPNPTSSEHIFNAFNNFEQQNQASLLVKNFTSVAPYASMHDDICNLALDKRTNIVIVPYHKHWGIHGRVGSTFPSIRSVNRNVIKKAPCSVGILIDRGRNGGNRSALTPQSPYHVGLLYFGGPDDWEALAYCRRMVEHPCVNLTVIRFVHENETNLDNEFINEFKTNAVISESNHYKEKIVKDGLETTQAIHSMSDDFDLVIVGKYHDPNSPLTLGLTTDTEWSECPELGIIGDMLASSNSRFSVLVVQQQPVLLDSLRSLPISRSRSLQSGAISTESSFDEDFTPPYSKLEEEIKGGK